MDERALTPVIGVVLLLAITLLLAGVFGLYVLTFEPNDTSPQARIAGEINTTTDTFVFVHEGGDPIDVHMLTVEIVIDDEPVRHQPHLPFFSQSGFHSGPTGPFNSESENIWKPGESASFVMACSNEPKPTEGTTVEVHLTVDGTPVDSFEPDID